MVNTITARQSGFLAALVKERDTAPLAQPLEAFRQEYRDGTATSERASFFISALLALPKKSSGPLTPGIYEDAMTSDLYRVYLGQKSGRMLCKRVVVGPSGKGATYVYAGAASRVLRGARRLDRREVAERALSYGSTHCLICGRRLDDPESVDRGVGPVCLADYS